MTISASGSDSKYFLLMDLHNRSLRAAWAEVTIKRTRFKKILADWVTPACRRLIATDFLFHVLNPWRFCSDEYSFAIHNRSDASSARTCYVLRVNNFYLILWNCNNSMFARERALQYCKLSYQTCIRHTPSFSTVCKAMYLINIHIFSVSKFLVGTELRISIACTNFVWR